jgi:hypothetical protein
MKTTKVVTTLHTDGYNLYGKRFIETWEKHFPTDWSIDYYSENHVPKFSDRICVLDFNSMCPEWTEFYDHVKAIGATDRKEINRLKKALRWSFKMFTLAHAIKHATTDYVIWMDSDVYAKCPPSKNWIQGVLGTSCVAGQVESVKHATHIETGILIVNVKHPDTSTLVNWIEQGYHYKKILDEPKPWDGFWIGKLYDSKTIDFKTIQMVIREQTSAKSDLAVAFSDHQLSWLAHRVGDRKFDESYSGRSGRTTDTELL